MYRFLKISNAYKFLLMQCKPERLRVNEEHGIMQLAQGLFERSTGKGRHCILVAMSTEISQGYFWSEQWEGGGREREPSRWWGIGRKHQSSKQHPLTQYQNSSESGVSDRPHTRASVNRGKQTQTHTRTQKCSHVTSRAERYIFILGF